MREIIFRGKSIDSGEWLYGDYAPRTSLYHANIFTKENCLEGVAVDEETVGQYTGLTDKDGRKIFEGDIVTYKIPFTDKAVKTETGTVIYEGCGFHIKEDGCMLCVADEECEIQVIGNIYDNDESAQSAEPSTQADNWLMSRFQKQE